MDKIVEAIKAVGFMLPFDRDDDEAATFESLIPAIRQAIIDDGELSPMQLDLLRNHCSH